MSDQLTLEADQGESAVNQQIEIYRQVLSRGCDLLPDLNLPHSADLDEWRKVLAFARDGWIRLNGERHEISHSTTI